MQNPFFNKTPAADAKAKIEQQLAAGKPVPAAKPGLVQGGVMGGMLKSLGLDPSAIDETAGKLVGGLEDLNARLDRIEAQQALTNKALVALDERAKSIESMLMDVLGRVASGTL